MLDQLFSQIINLIILILYRTGFKGEFLGVGGTWNLNEDKSPDAEIVASGVLVGFFIYTSVVLITFCFGSTYHKRTLVEIIMNFVGTFMFIAVGGTALHYWHGYLPEHKFDTIVQERQELTCFSIGVIFNLVGAIMGIERAHNSTSVAVLDDRGLALEGETIDREERVNVKSIKLGDGKGKHRRVRMADEGQQEQRLPKERKMIGHLPFLMKILEVILSVFAIGLIVDPLNSFQRILIRSKFKLDDAAIIYISIAGYIIINTLFIICHFLGDRIPKRTTVKYDLMTSVSSIRVPSGDEDGIPEHCYRKMGCARRRQYVDRPTSARSKSALDIAKCQTEQPMMCSMQCQTQQNVVETPVQTVSKCELCNRQMQVFSPAMEVPLAGQHPAPCVPCPALLQLFRGAPCCPGCRCVAGIVQVPQQSQHQQTQRQDQEQPTTNDVQWVQQDQKSYGMLTNEQRESKMSGVSGTITKLTLASYCVTPSKKTDISSQTTDDEMSVGRKISETSEQKKQRASVQTVPKEKVRESSSMESESLEQHKGKAKTSVSSEKEASKPSARKSSLKSSSSKAGSKRPSEDQKPSEPAPDVSQDVYEEQSEMVVPAADPALVPPPQKVAQMITLLQEIEGGKGSDDADKVATEASKVEEGKIFGVEASVETSILMEESEIGVDIHENVKEAAAEEIEDTKEEIKEEDKDEVKKKANDEGKQEAREEAKEEHKEKDNEKAKEKAKKENTVEAREEVTEGVKKQIDRPVKEGGITICELKKECLPTPKEAHKKAKKRADSDSTSSDASTGSINESVKSKAEVLSLSRLSTGRERQSMRTTSTTKPDAETQAIDIDLSFNKTKKMSFLKKRNKVEPAEIVTADTDVQTWFSEDHSDEVVSEGIKPDVEVLYRQEANDLKRLRCTRCGNSLRQKSSRSEGPVKTIF
ncbi:hypothetical protein WN55_04535 [Dufourea novaeangliae]|uniref:Uncharacterized protein n=1 Tax=Dufourea novaeangliae TaxID=178035 RepID=A0A154P0Z2_DUFNO|nr:hypothetical protein WN55_04535 [Dufourea novaeangliae]